MCVHSVPERLKDRSVSLEDKVKPINCRPKKIKSKYIALEIPLLSFVPVSPNRTTHSLIFITLCVRRCYGYKSVSEVTHQQNGEAGYCDNPREKGTLLCLVHSEMSEAIEGERKNLMDGHLPYRKIAEVKLADAVIRILDYAHAFGYDFEGALVYAALQYCQTLHKWSGFRHHQEHAS